MSRLVVPLLGRTLMATGDVLLRAELDLLIRNNHNVLCPETFQVDSGAEMTVMPASVAKRLDLPFPQLPIPGATHSQTGLVIRPGVIRAQVLGMDGTEYVFPCYFLGDPNTSINMSRVPGLPRNLLGLTGVVDKIRLCTDGRPTAGAKYGNLIVEKQ